MPPRAKVTPSLPLLDPAGPEPARVAAVAKIADRVERSERLSDILRDPEASGAEKVAASRQLESMERQDATSLTQGLPPPTVRPEQVMRCVRLLTAFGPRITLEALEILAQRYERARAVSMQNRKDGKLFDLTELPNYRKRLKPEKEEKSVEERGEGERSESGAGGATSAEPNGLPELREAEEPLGPPPNEDEQHGDGDGVSTSEDGGEK